MTIPITSLILVAFVFIIAMLIYYIFYTIKINRKIQSDNVVSSFRMISIPKMLTFSIICALIFCGLVLIIGLRKANDTINSYSRNDYVLIDVSDEDNYSFMSFSPNCMYNDASFAKIYSCDSNEGYTKETKQDGDFSYTIFKSINKVSSFQPDFLCFVEYTGKANDDLSLFQNIIFSNHTFDAGNGFSGSFDAKKMLYIGNLDENSSFKICLDVLDADGTDSYNQAEEKAYREDKGEFPNPSDYALFSSTMDISW